MTMERKELICREDDVRLDTWISRNMEGFSRNHVQKLLAEGHIKVNGNEERANYRIREGDHVTIRLPEPKTLQILPEKIQLDILYEDEHIIVINKPKNMVVHPAAGNHSGTLVNALMEHCAGSLSDINGIIRPGIVHRIDKDTTGVLVVAKNNNAHEKLSSLLKDHDIQRIYLALVEGIIKEDGGKIDAPIGRHPVDRKKMAVNVKNGRRAVTNFKVLKRFKDATLVEVSLQTGRTHQIRVHMAYIDHPLLGDQVYGRKHQKHDAGGGQALHAKVLGFVHPASGQYMEFSAEPPEAFRRLVEKLDTIK